jgi:hypothetical protein
MPSFIGCHRPRNEGPSPKKTLAPTASGFGFRRVLMLSAGSVFNAMPTHITHWPHGPCGGLRAKAGLLPVEWVMRLFSKKEASSLAPNFRRRSTSIQYVPAMMVRIRILHDGR